MKRHYRTLRLEGGLVGELVLDKANLSPIGWLGPKEDYREELEGRFHLLQDALNFMVQNNYRVVGVLPDTIVFETP